MKNKDQNLLRALLDGELLMNQEGLAVLEVNTHPKL